MKEEILFVNKSLENALSEDEVVRAFNKAKTLDEIKSIVEKSEFRALVTWASVDAVDKAKEKIPIEDVIREQEILLKRDAPIQDDHTNAHVGKTLAYKVLEHPDSKTMGVLHLNKIFDDNIKDDSVWKDIIDGKKTGSSVGGVTDKEHSVEMNNGQPVKVLEGFNHYETSMVENPCNPFATNVAFSVIAKSGDHINKQAQEKSPQACDEKTTKGDIMSDKKDIKKEEENPAPEGEPKGEESQKKEAKESTKANDEVSDEEEGDAMKKIAESISKLDERLNEIEDKISGAPQKAEDSEEDEDEEAKEEEEDKPDEEEKSEPMKADELQKKVEAQDAEIAELKKHLNIKGVVKTDRPAEKEAKAPKEPNMNEVMKYHFENGQDTKKTEEFINKIKGEKK